MPRKTPLLLLPMQLFAIEPCTLCKDRWAISLPNHMIQLPGYPKLSCSTADALMPSLLPDETAPECDLARQFSSLCGCPIKPNSCNLCADGSRAPYPNVKLVEFVDIFGANVPNTCEWVEAYLHSFNETDEFCLSSQELVASKCGCMNTNYSLSDSELHDCVNCSEKKNASNVLKTLHNISSPPNLLDFVGKANYFGANNEQDVIVLYSCSRAASILSAISCIALMYDCFRSKGRRKNLYHQLVGTMSAFDFIYSFSLALGTLPMDSHDIFDNLGEIGNSVTCKIQGGALQLGGMTSLFLSCSLATYYVLVVVYNAKESSLAKIRKWLLGVPIVCGSVLAFASVSMIYSGVVGCHLTPPIPFVSSEVLQKLGLPHASWPFYSFLIVPGYTAILYCTILILFMMHRMRQVDQNSQKWIIPNCLGNTERRMRYQETALTKLRRKVFFQCFQYLIVVYATWLTYLTATLEAAKFITSHYALWLCIFILSGIQGFLNCMVYFRPRIHRHFNKRSKLKKQMQMAIKEESNIASYDQSNLNSIQGLSRVARAEPAVDIIAATEGILQERMKMKKIMENASSSDGISTSDNELIPNSTEFRSLSLNSEGEESGEIETPVC